MLREHGEIASPGIERAERRDRYDLGDFFHETSSPIDVRAVMPSVNRASAIVLCSFPVWCACRTTSTDTTRVDATPRATAPTDPKELWAAYMRLATPTENHRALEPMIGTFRATTTAWMEPGADPEEMHGTMENRWILGGRFVQGKLESQMNGMPFEGLLTLGFDNAKHRYVATWLDNMGTSMMPVMEGTADASGKVITISGTMDDPVRQKAVRVREKWTIQSRDQHDFEMWVKEGDGPEFQSLEIVYTRM
jgi:hypothetical protein